MARDTFPIKVAGTVVVVLLLAAVGVGVVLLGGGDEDDAAATEQIASADQDLNELDAQLEDALAERAVAAGQTPDSAAPDTAGPAAAGDRAQDRGAAAPPPTRSSAPDDATAVDDAAAVGAAAAVDNAADLNADGLRHFRQGDYALALQRFARARELAPRDPHVRNNYAWTLHKMGRQREAAAELEAVLGLDPDREIAYANLGEVLLAQGDTAGAVIAYERFLELNEDPARERVATEKLERIR